MHLHVLYDIFLDKKQSPKVDVIVAMFRNTAIHATRPASHVICLDNDEAHVQESWLFESALFIKMFRWQSWYRTKAIERTRLTTKISRKLLLLKNIIHQPRLFLGNSRETNVAHFGLLETAYHDEIKRSYAVSWRVARNRYSAYWSNWKCHSSPSSLHLYSKNACGHRLPENYANLSKIRGTLFRLFLRSAHALSLCFPTILTVAV